MNLTDLLFSSYCILFSLIWCITCIYAISNVLKIALFEEAIPPVPKAWPKLTVIIAARNEDETIEKAVSTLLNQDYPSLEIIVVNDRSTDRTGEIIEGMAVNNKRLQAVHIKSLPEGWLGKVYALHTGTQKATGEWILYTDADVHFSRGTLRKSVALALSKKCDHLTLIPKPKTDSFWLETVIQAFGLMFILGTRAANVGNPKSKAFIGAGAFNMVKKSALEKTEGFSWLRMETADDVGLGLMLKRSGAHGSLAVSINDISLTWYKSVSDMSRGVEKNIFGASTQYSLWRMTIICLFLWLLFLAPIIALLYQRVNYLRFFGLTAYLCLIFCAILNQWKFKQGFIPSVFTPVGHLIISLMLVRSGILCKLRGGIIWRGTRYAIHDLRTGQRVKFDLFSRLSS